MQKLREFLHTSPLSPQRVLLRLITALLLFSSFSILTIDAVPFSSPDFIRCVNPLLCAAFLIFYPLLAGALSYLYDSLRLEKTLLLISTMLFSALLLYNSADAYLFVAAAALVAVVVWYCFTGETVCLIRDSRALTLVVWCALGLLFVLFVGGLTALRYKLYYSPCFDFGIFAQMFASMRKTGLPMTTCERSTPLSHFAVHLSFIYYTLLPFTYLFRSPMFLNVAQAAVLASGLVPMYLLCRDRKLSTSVTIALGCAYALHPALGAGCFYDIHENCFLTPLLLWLLLSIERDNTLGVILSAVLVWSVKEDAPIYVMFICVWAFFAKRKVIKPLVLLIFTVAYFLAAVWYLDTHGDGAMLYRYANYSTEGGSIRDIVRAVATDPGYVFRQCLDGEKLKFLMPMLLPLAFLPLISRKFYNYILLGPFMLINLMSNYPYQHSLDFQYNFGTVALLLYLAVDNLSAVKKPERQRAAAWLCALLSACAAFTFVAGRMTYIEQYRSSKDVCARIDAVVEQVPADASVSAATLILPHLAEHAELYQINGNTHETDGKTEYVIIDLRFQEFRDLYPIYISAGYELVAYEPDAAVLLRCPFYGASE